MSIVKNNVIVYCRVSRLSDPNSISMDSQEDAIKKFSESKNLGIYCVFKNIGSAFKTLQKDIKRLLNSCRNKTVIVFDPSRLSRNTKNFFDIYKICKKNNHNIGIVSMNTIFNIKVSTNKEILYDLIKKAEQESIDMGIKISRTLQYKKSKEPIWGKMINSEGKTIDNHFENKITLLIFSLSTEGSSILKIKKLVSEVGKTEGVELFEIEYTDRSPVIGDKLPMEMSPSKIVETFKIYGIKKRRAYWKVSDINHILDRNIVPLELDEDHLSDRLSDIEITTNTQDVSAPINQQPVSWVSFYYHPNIGVPKGIVLPVGMQLPTMPTLLYIPKF
jgi:DNA invertase Pin-like site-specific DNA recombinase